MKKLSRKDFLERAKLFHGDSYDYSETTFTTIKNPINIKCKNGHFFTTITELHITGRGKCPACLGINLEGFVEKARIIHKNKYDYSKVEYINTKTKVEIICPITEHEPFWQTPVKHILSGRGCPKCAGRKSPDEYVILAKQKHGNTFNYDSCVYKNPTSHVKIICSVHGPFLQNPREHLKGAKCPRCSGFYKTTEEFIEEANIVHKNLYDYSKTKYSLSETKVEISCRIHGSFWQTPYSHLKGNGCSKCSRNVSRAESEWLDYLNIPEGFRHHSIKVPGYKRALIVDAYDPTTNTVYEYYGDFWHGNPKYFIRSELHRKKKGTYGEAYDQTLLREVRIRAQGYNLVTIWESDWLKIC